MEDNNAARSVSKQAGMACPGIRLDDATAVKALRIADEEAGRLFALGVVPYSLDRSDLLSTAHEAIVKAQTQDLAHIRAEIRGDMQNACARARRDAAGIELPLITGDVNYDRLNLAELAALGMSEDELLPVRLAYYEDLTETQAAQRLGIPQQTLHDRLIRSLKKIKNILR